MITRRKLSGLAIATAAAGIFALSAPVSSVSADEAVQCMGANSCKGLSDCKTASSECKGLNNCKGQGFVAVSKAECDELGGTTG